MSAATTTSVQRATIRALRQGVAAELVGINARTLRDSTDAPRNVDGTYPGPELVTWSRSRIAAPTLSDEETERILVAVEELGGDPAAPAVAELLRDLAEDHGDAGLVAFARQLMEAVEADIAPVPDVAELARCEAEYRQRQARREALRVAVVCERCSRVRCGATWLDQAAPSDCEIVKDVCPVCRARS